MLYELFYLIAGSKEADVKKIQEEIKKIVTEEGGVFEPKVTVEKRRLAYKIKHETFGIYTAQRFDLEDAEKFRVINRRLNLYPEVLRFLISRASELPELMSREERIAASEKAAQREKQMEVKKAEPEEKSAKGAMPAGRQGSASGGKPAKNEDIDKQLEEILNI